MNEYILSKKDWNIKEIDNRLPVLCEHIFKAFPYEEAPIDINAIYEIHYNKRNVECVATINYYGEITVLEDAKLFYKINGAFTNNVVYLEAKEKEFIRNDSEGNIYLVAGSKFTSLKTISDILLGKDDKHLSSWFDEDGKSFEDSILNLIDYKE